MKTEFPGKLSGGGYAMCQKFRKFYFVKLVLSKCTCKSLFCSFWRSDFGGWSHKLTLSIRPSVWLEKRQEIACQRFGRHPEGLSRLILFREIGLISFVKSVCPLVENIYIYIYSLFNANALLGSYDGSVEIFICHGLNARDGRYTFEGLPCCPAALLVHQISRIFSLLS